MRQLQIDLVQKSWRKILPKKEATAEMFFAKLFELDPALRGVVNGNLAEQGFKLMQLLNTVIEELNDWDEVAPLVQVLGVKLSKNGVKDEDYEIIRTALITTLTNTLGTEFKEDIKLAWIAVYTELIATMKQAACELSIH